MYREDDGQITLAEYMSPFGELDRNNRWARIAEIIPWKRYEGKYAGRFSENNGAPAIKFRMAMGALIIKQRTGHSDEEVLLDIMENPYMQFLIGLHEFTTEAPFSSVSMTNFRKYITKDMINEINDDIFRGSAGGGNDERDDGDGGAGPQDMKGDEAGNKGELMLDATCAPACIAYPTDIGLLNEAREKLEDIIDALHPHTGDKIKPRTYRRTARHRFLLFAKRRRPRKDAVRKAVGQQLRYAERDIRHIDRQLRAAGPEFLSERQWQWLATIRELCRQQRRMHDAGTHSVEKRVVSIGQPHVRPIVRGKTNAPVEFGAKVSASLVDGYAFIDKLGWEAYNEESLLIPAVEAYRERNGFYPEAVLVDKIYRNRANRAYCRKHGVRISGPRLGRPPKETDRAAIRQERLDSAKRNGIEGKFGEGKTKYGLDRIMARLKDSSETVIAMSFLCMNISHRLRASLRRLRFGVLAAMHWFKPALLQKTGVI